MAFLKVRQAFCFGALCGTAFWALTQSYSDGTEDYWSCSNVAYALITLHGMFGFWKYGRSTSNARIPKFYKPLSLLSSIYTIPLICVDMYLFNFFNFEVAYFHLIYPFVALFHCLRKKKRNCKGIDIVNFMSLTSLSFVSAMSKNYWGLSAAVVHAVANYVIRQSGKILGVNCRELTHVLMAVFVFLSLRSLVTAEKNWVKGTGLPGHLW